MFPRGRRDLRTAAPRARLLWACRHRVVGPGHKVEEGLRAGNQPPRGEAGLAHQGRPAREEAFRVTGEAAGACGVGEGRGEERGLVARVGAQAEAGGDGRGSEADVPIGGIGIPVGGDVQPGRRPGAPALGEGPDVEIAGGGAEDEGG